MLRFVPSFASVSQGRSHYRSLQALTKFARCVDWSHRKERKQAMKLISEWEAIEVDHALELLSASFAGINPLRRYAVKRLEEAKVRNLFSVEP